MLDLLQIGDQIAASNQQIKTACKSSVIFLPASKLVRKITEFKTFSDNIVYKFFMSKNGILSYNTINIYKDIDENVKIYTPSMTELFDCECVEFLPGYNGYAILRYGDLSFKSSISCNIEYAAKLQSSKNFDLIKGFPKSNQVDFIPIVELPLHRLQAGLKYKVLQKTNLKTKYGNDTYNIESETGIKYNNVIPNTKLEKMIIEHGLGVEFLIVSVSEIKDKEGQKTKKVMLQDLSLPDFNDLEI